MIELKIPMKIASEANKVTHWIHKFHRKNSQKKKVIAYWKNFVKEKIELPVKVVLTRHSPRKFDSDNLVSAFKFIRDCVADLLRPGHKPGRADDSPLIQFEYFQERSKEYFITIKILSCDIENI